MQAFAALTIAIALWASHSIMDWGEEKIIWSCGASTSTHSYQVFELDRSAATFELVIYDGPIFDKAKYIETVRITVERVGDRQLTGSGQTAAGTTVRVSAFGGTVAFYVDNELLGTAAGRCERNIEVN